MSVLIRCTPDLPKLCEAGARTCYNSFDKANKTSHQLVKNLFKMPKPHLSIGHHGNALLCLSMPDDLNVKEIKQYPFVLSSLLLTLSHNSKGYINVTTNQTFPDSKFDAVISGNAVAFMNALNPIADQELEPLMKKLYDSIMEALRSVPETLFFFDAEEGYAHVDNRYLMKKDMQHNQLVVYDDFSDILTEEEREVHETATVYIRTSRDIAKQFNRHDAGISQLSQRYVLPFDLEGQKFKDFLDSFSPELYETIKRFRHHVPEGIDPHKKVPLYVATGDYPDDVVDLDPEDLLWNSHMSYDQMMQVIETFFYSVFFNEVACGANHKRANEMARSLLPNSMDTVVMYTRSKWKWRHFLDLRVDTHTQLEARREAIPLLETFQRESKWFLDYDINKSNLTAKKRGDK